MRTWIFEATQSIKGEGFANWGRFLVGAYDHEWIARSEIGDNLPILMTAGTTSRKALWVLDLVTREGACFFPGGSARADLEKHRVWVCPMFLPFLEWLYEQEIDGPDGYGSGLDSLPRTVELPDAPFALAEPRRQGGGCDGW